MHLPLTLDEYREDLRRFMRVAATKQARLVVFPELGGVMVAPPILRDFRSQLLKRQDRGRRKRASLWERVVGGLAGTTAALVGADFRRGLAALLDVAAQDIWQAYVDVFGALAREYSMVVIGPSAYLPDPVDGVIRNISVVFDADGQIAGRQAKVVLHPSDADLVQAGTTWDVIATDAGQLGLILGSDVLYPEVGRVLAYQGAEMIVVQAACTEQALYEKIRTGALARMQDNQLFTVTRFLVGDHRLSRAQRSPFAGKSAIFAPQELSPRSNGVLVEMGNLRSEGVLAAEWDFVALRELWEKSETPVRQQLPLQQAGQVLAQLYARLQMLPKVMSSEQLSPDVAIPRSSEPRADTPWQELDDLVVIATTTQRWPLSVVPQNYALALEDDGEDFVVMPEDFDPQDFPDDFDREDFDRAGHEAGTMAGVQVNGASAKASVTNVPQAGDEMNDVDESGTESGEDETDEMDAVPGSDRGR
jgi:predicted amidohydrolase